MGVPNSCVIEKAIIAVSLHFIHNIEQSDVTC